MSVSVLRQHGEHDVLGDAGPCAHLAAAVLIVSTTARATGRPMWTINSGGSQHGPTSGRPTAITALREAHGHDALAAALRRAVQFRRFTADDVRSILAAGPAAPTPTRPGSTLDITVPAVPTRTLDAYRTDSLREVA